jgi:hypothetical protein
VSSVVGQHVVTGDEEHEHAGERHAIETMYAVTIVADEAGRIVRNADTPSEPASSATNSVASEPIMRTTASVFPCRNERFGVRRRC